MKKLALRILFVFSPMISILAQGGPTIVWTVQANPTLIDAVSVSADGETILTSSNHHVRTFRTNDGTMINNFDFPNVSLISSSISPDGSHYTAGYSVGTYPPSGESSFNDMASNSLLFTVPGCFSSFSPDGSLIAATGGGVYRYVNVHLTSNGTELFNVYNGGYTSDVQFTPDGNMVAVSSSDNTIKLYDAMSGTLVKTFSGHTNDVNTIKISPDGNILASGAGGWDASGESSIKIWNISDGDLITTLEGHGYWVDDLVFSSDGKYLISSGRDGLNPVINAKIKLWRTSDWTLEIYYNEGMANGVRSLSVVPGTNMFLFGNSYGELTLAELPSVIPVELVSFVAQAKENHVVLNWTTSTETNNRGFDILRNAEDEHIGWISVGFVEGNGTTTEVSTYSFTDENVPVGSYNYRLVQIDLDGTKNESDPITVEVIFQPNEYVLEQNYPNPFNPGTKIQFSIPQTSFVTLEVFNLLGESVGVLVSEELNAGTYNYNWGATSLTSGVYLYKLQAGNFVQTKKMVLMK